MTRIDRIVSCARCCMPDCPHIESARMQAVCYLSATEFEARSGNQGTGIMSSYMAAEILCRDCPEYLPRGAA